MKYATLMAGVALFLTASAFSAEVLTREAFNKVHTQYTKVGAISSTGQTAPNDAREELIKKADEKDVDVIVLLSGNTDKKLHTSASIYKKKQLILYLKKHYPIVRVMPLACPKSLFILKRYLIFPA